MNLNLDVIVDQLKIQISKSNDFKTKYHEVSYN